MAASGADPVAVHAQGTRCGRTTDAGVARGVGHRTEAYRVIFRRFAFYLGWAARTGTHVPERIEEEEYRQC